MNRYVSKPQRIGDEQVRYRVRLEDTYEVNEGSAEWIARQTFMLEAILHSPELLYCGASRWQKLRVYFDGVHWACEAEAVLHEAL